MLREPLKTGTIRRIQRSKSDFLKNKTGRSSSARFVFHEMVVPSNSLSSIAFLRFERLVPLIILAGSLIFCASLAPIGSTGEGIPGLHFSGIRVLYFAHETFLNGFASSNFLGSLSYTKSMSPAIITSFA